MIYSPNMYDDQEGWVIVYTWYVWWLRCVVILSNYTENHSNKLIKKDLVIELQQYDEIRSIL